jgi:hypothetical protein
VIDRFLRAAFVVLAMALFAIAVLGLAGCGFDPDMPGRWGGGRPGSGPIKCAGANCGG